VKGAEDQVVTTGLSTLLTALYVEIDDWLGRCSRPGRPPLLSDAELVTLAVAQALLGIRSEARWLRFVPADLDRWLTERGVTILRPSYRNLTPRPGEHLLKPIRQLIESVNDTLKGQLDLELHGGRTIEGAGTRIAQRLLALTAAIWHNRHTAQPITRSLTAYDH
jgi:hypothetical protein